ncbi:MAG: hypothetical protein KDB14_28110 [Planctomycetales bacterium]|nr:hypothetical protein [Planctomycetales bacterium]
MLAKHQRVSNCRLPHQLSVALPTTTMWLAAVVFLGGLSARLSGDANAQAPTAKPRIAGLATVYRHNSHGDVIHSRYLETDTLDGKGAQLPAEMVSLHVLQTPESDMSRRMAAAHGVRLSDSVADALTLGGDKLAVDGVVLVAEHGEFPLSEIGQKQYPKRQLFAQVAAVMERSGRSAPVFSDKMLSDNWEDAEWIYREAKRLKIPLMAGSSLPTAWRFPPVDMPRGAAVAEITAVSYGQPESYGFHALEMVQCLAERRGQGETGVAAVRCLEGEAVWQALAAGEVDREALQACLDLQSPQRATDKPLSARVKRPVLFGIEYRDGLRANVLVLNGAVRQWAAAWRLQDGSRQATQFWVQEQRPFMHFTYLLEGVNRMFATGKPSWPVERTLLTTGMLNAVFRSQADGGARIETPHLRGLAYTSDWNWRQPPWPANEPPRKE